MSFVNKNMRAITPHIEGEAKSELDPALTMTVLRCRIYTQIEVYGWCNILAPGEWFNVDILFGADTVFTKVNDCGFEEEDWEGTPLVEIRNWYIAKERNKKRGLLAAKQDVGRLLMQVLQDDQRVFDTSPPEDDEDFVARTYCWTGE